MNSEPKGARPLREIEMEVEAEGREWTRRRLQQRLQEEAGRHGEIPPLSGRTLAHRRRRRMQLRTGSGAGLTHTPPRGSGSRAARTPPAQSGRNELPETHVFSAFVAPLYAALLTAARSVLPHH